MSFKIGSNSVRGLVLNIGLVLVLLGLMSFVFFYKVMPYVTNQNKVVTVPDLRGMTNKEAVRFLAARQLQYEFGDSLFRADVDPLLVLDQYPKANSKVKIYRKIKLNLNAATPPLVVYPDLSGFTYQFARQQLESLGLSIGNIYYKSDIAVNAVLESQLAGKTLLPGQQISKGTVVDLIIGMPGDKSDFMDSINIR
ncbi:PASTA domain-containing protein [Ohtaekwangia kribbensis]|jgi:beta-lactam-binding protein with PASTA domain|uniref:PASTA domain-containing protein n=1 Tax=Ohtaekwangia kribbensis TaxID=688913 RepID=A0ABW3K4N8_9BACT